MRIIRWYSSDSNSARLLRCGILTFLATMAIYRHWNLAEILIPTVLAATEFGILLGSNAEKQP